jgi:hypothetical protein
MPCVWRLNPRLPQATKPLWPGYGIKMAQKLFVREIFPMHGNRLSKLCKYAKSFATRLARASLATI